MDDNNHKGIENNEDNHLAGFFKEADDKQEVINKNAMKNGLGTPKSKRVTKFKNNMDSTENTLFKIGLGAIGYFLLPIIIIAIVIILASL